MPLSAGDKPGPYEVLAPIGKGGMGEVYRAKDTRLDRHVAIKILPAPLASEPDRLARFEREARVLASLNHPNIATIYGLEESSAGKAIAMELVDGSTLAPPRPLNDTLKIASQVAAALEATHEKGIIHRDLKPANIMITPSGAAKVLDFGLATAAHATDASAGPNLPTVTMGMALAGVVMGTPAYMAPEQATGKPVDRRADIWSFGVVLWEMLTGERLFQGETMSHVMANVINQPLDFAKVKAPKPILVLLQRCLDRDINSRLQWIGEARIALEKYLANPAADADVGAKPAASRASWTSKVAWPITALAFGAAGWFAWKSTRPSSATDRPMMRLSVDLGPEAVRSPRVSVIISPDGKRIVYTGKAPKGNGTARLYTRLLDQDTSTVLPGFSGTDLQPFFSPNGEWVGFWSDGKIFKVPVQGGVAVPVADANGPAGAAWGDDDGIVVRLFDGLWRLPAN